MKKHISTNVFYCIAAYVILLITTACVIMEIFAIYLFIVDYLDASSLESLFATGIFCLINIFLTVGFNRINCWVWVDDGYVKRKGFWFGFKKEVRISDIERVETYVYYRGGAFLQLITGESGNVIRTSKKSYISLKCTKKNFKFLKTFWNGNVDGNDFWKSRL